jgi:hypothetical protein
MIYESSDVVYRWHWERVAQVDCFLLPATSAIPMFVTLVLLFTVIIRKTKGLWSQPKPDWSFTGGSPTKRNPTPADDAFAKPEMPADPSVTHQQGYFFLPRLSIPPAGTFRGAPAPGAPCAVLASGVGVGKTVCRTPDGIAGEYSGERLPSAKLEPWRGPTHGRAKVTEGEKQAQS